MSGVPLIELLREVAVKLNISEDIGEEYLNGLCQSDLAYIIHQQYQVCRLINDNVIVLSLILSPSKIKDRTCKKDMADLILWVQNFYKSMKT